MPQTVQTVPTHLTQVLEDLYFRTINTFLHGKLTLTIQIVYIFGWLFTKSQQIQYLEPEASVVDTLDSLFDGEDIEHLLGDLEQYGSFTPKLLPWLAVSLCSSSSEIKCEKNV